MKLKNNGLPKLFYLHSNMSFLQMQLVVNLENYMQHQEI